MFSPYGELREIHIIRGTDGSSKGCAFVKFANRQSAVTAIEVFNDFTPGGATKPFVVKFAVGKKPGNFDTSDGLLTPAASASTVSSSILGGIATMGQLAASSALSPASVTQASLLSASSLSALSPQWQHSQSPQILQQPSHLLQQQLLDRSISQQPRLVQQGKQHEQQLPLHLQSKPIFSPHEDHDDTDLLARQFAHTSLDSQLNFSSTNQAENSLLLSAFEGDGSDAYPAYGRSRQPDPLSHYSRSALAQPQHESHQWSQSMLNQQSQHQKFVGHYSAHQMQPQTSFVSRNNDSGGGDSRYDVHASNFAREALLRKHNSNVKPPEGPSGANLFIYHLPRDLTDADLVITFSWSFPISGHIPVPYVRSTPV